MSKEIFSIVLGLIVGPLAYPAGIYIWRNPNSDLFLALDTMWEKRPIGERTVYKRIVGAVFVLVGLWFIVIPVIEFFRH
jgi:hypothetical protein